ncbi:lysis protein [Enterobacter sp. SA187]|uniref:lysis protein n=1 Tax=Enterobacter sp. SA187 TaxID=1914861 RepID=UPI0009FA0FF9|nr:lysis protein [Enterobacter sp. SA187]
MIETFTALGKKLWLPLLVAAVIGAQAFFVNHYRDNAVTYKDQRDKATSALNLAKETITDMQTRQREVAALDAKYTRELANAQKTIDQLELDVAAGRKRLRLNAKCPANGEASTSSVDDGSGPRLTDSAERNYYTLRRRIETITNQITGLQAYVREQCLS